MEVGFGRWRTFCAFDLHIHKVHIHLQNTEGYWLTICFDTNNCLDSSDWNLMSAVEINVSVMNGFVCAIYSLCYY